MNELYHRPPSENRFDTLENAVTRLFYWQYHNTNSHSDKVCALYSVSDRDNRRRLCLAYPKLGEAWDMWHAAGHNGQDLFVEYGFSIPGG